MGGLSGVWRAAGAGACLLVVMALAAFGPPRPSAPDPAPPSTVAPDPPPPPPVAIAPPITPPAEAPVPEALPALAVNPGLTYIVRQDRWTASDEKGYGEFIRSIGESNCHTVNACLKGGGNPFRASDPSYLYFKADCADLPYFLRAYYAWKRGLPFAYEASVAPVGHSRDMRYSASGNEVLERNVVTTGSTTGPELLARMRDSISSAMYRIHPTREKPIEPDHYSVALSPKAIHAGTVIYDPNGHLAIVYKIESDGRIRYIDAHPDNSLTRGTYDQRFVRARPGMGSGFKNWRPIEFIGATRDASGALRGGRLVAAKDADLPDYSVEQFYGNGHERPSDSNWSSGPFTLGKERLDYYDYVRAQMAGGSLHFNPVDEVRNMVRSNCDDLHYRADAVNMALAIGIQNQAHPPRLPINIYGTEGDWEIYSTPSRDARLKTAFAELRIQVERFVRLHAKHDPKIVYRGNDLVGDLIATYDHETAACSVSYIRTDRSVVTLSYEQARQRLFRLSFDPYHCVELRWGAAGNEGLTCRDGDNKRAWYAAEQRLRNQIERTYEARMDHSLSELRQPGGEGKGVDHPPDTDVRAFLVAVRSHGLEARGGGHPPVAASSTR